MRWNGKREGGGTLALHRALLIFETPRSATDQDVCIWPSFGSSSLSSYFYFGHLLPLMSPCCFVSHFFVTVSTSALAPMLKGINFFVYVYISALVFHFFSF